MWNLTIQRDLGQGFIGSIGYVGRRGTRLYRSWDVNQIDARPILPASSPCSATSLSATAARADGTLANNTACPGASAVPLIQQGVMASAFANSTASVSDLSPTQNAAGNMAVRLEQTTLAARLRPNQQFAQILLLDNGADSIYHSLQMTIRKRFDSAGLLFSGGYTLSKSIDNLSTDPVGSTSGGGLTTTSARTPADGRNYRNERARSDFDQRHVVNFSGIYELPFGRGKSLLRNANRAVNAVIGGWSLNSRSTPTSPANPFTIRSGFLTANGSAQSRAALAPALRNCPSPSCRTAGVLGPVFFPDASMFVNPSPANSASAVTSSRPDVLETSTSASRRASSSPNASGSPSAPRCSTPSRARGQLPATPRCLRRQPGHRLERLRPGLAAWFADIAPPAPPPPNQNGESSRVIQFVDGARAGVLAASALRPGRAASAIPRRSPASRRRSRCPAGPRAARSGHESGSSGHPHAGRSRRTAGRSSGPPCGLPGKRTRIVLPRNAPRSTAAPVRRRPQPQRELHLPPRQRVWPDLRSRASRPGSTRAVAASQLPGGPRVVARPSGASTSSGRSSSSSAASAAVGFVAVAGVGAPMI
jgi:hypothetical protein